MRVRSSPVEESDPLPCVCLAAGSSPPPPPSSSSSCLPLSRPSAHCLLAEPVEIGRHTLGTVASYSAGHAWHQSCTVVIRPPRQHWLLVCPCLSLPPVLLPLADLVHGWTDVRHRLCVSSGPYHPHVPLQSSDRTLCLWVWRQSVQHQPSTDKSRYKVGGSRVVCWPPYGRS